MHRSFGWLRLVLAVLAVVAGPGCTRASDDLIQSLTLAETAEADRSGLSLMWFGTASTLVDDGTDAVLIDPYVSRPSVSALTVLFGRQVEPDQDALTHWYGRLPMDRVRSVLISHGHFDHALDAADFGRKAGAQVLGSQDVVSIVRAHGNENVAPIEAGTFEPLPGDFAVTAYSGRHGRPPLLIDPLARQTDSNFAYPASVWDYGMGDVLQIRLEHKAATLVHVGSAGHVTGALEGATADILMLALVGRRGTDDFLAETVGRVRPKLVIPMHFDSPFTPLDQPLKATFLARLIGFACAMKEDYPDIAVGFLPFKESWAVPRAALLNDLPKIDELTSLNCD